MTTANTNDGRIDEQRLFPQGAAQCDFIACGEPVHETVYHPQGREMSVCHLHAKGIRALSRRRFEPPKAAR